MLNSLISKDGIEVIINAIVRPEYYLNHACKIPKQSYDTWIKKYPDFMNKSIFYLEYTEPCYIQSEEEWVEHCISQFGLTKEVAIAIRPHFAGKDKHIAVPEEEVFKTFQVKGD